METNPLQRYNKYFDYASKIVHRKCTFFCTYCVYDDKITTHSHSGVRCGFDPPNMADAYSLPFREGWG